MWTKKKPNKPPKRANEVVLKCPVCHQYIGGAPDELKPAYMTDFQFFCPSCKAWRHIYREDLIYGQI
jgi:hypothetical protein